MICDDHEVSHLEVKIDSSCRIGHEKVLYSEHLHHTDRERYKFHCVTLIIMETSLHCDHRLSTEVSCYEVSFVADSRRHREPWYFLVRNHYLVLYLFSKFAKSASEHDAHHRLVTVQP